MRNEQNGIDYMYVCLYLMRRCGHGIFEKKNKTHYDTNLPMKYNPSLVYRIEEMEYQAITNSAKRKETEAPIKF